MRASSGIVHQHRAAAEAAAVAEVPVPDLQLVEEGRTGDRRTRKDKVVKPWAAAVHKMRVILHCVRGCNQFERLSQVSLSFGGISFPTL